MVGKVQDDRGFYIPSDYILSFVIICCYIEINLKKWMKKKRKIHFREI